MCTETHQFLESLNEPVYLHQVVGKQAGKLTRYLDIPDALSVLNNSLGAEWRIHFHVPIFLEEMESFETTQFFLKKILSHHKKKPVTGQLEVETYTWSVLPKRYRKTDINLAIARELSWVKKQLKL